MDFQGLIPDDLVSLFNRYRTYIIASGLAIGGGIGLLVYLHMNNISRQESAQMALAETIQEFSRAQQFPDLWHDVEIAAKTGYRQYQKTTLSPFFLLLQAHALAELSKLDEALPVMQQALNAMSVKSPLYYVSAIKLARMQIDSSDDSIKQQGVELLQKLATTKENLQQDEALYYLGLYNFDHNNADEAKKIWQQLIDTFKSADKPSPWVMLAEREMQG